MQTAAPSHNPFQRNGPFNNAPQYNAAPQNTRLQDGPRRISPPGNAPLQNGRPDDFSLHNTHLPKTSQQNAPLEDETLQDGHQRWPREITTSGQCKSPLDHLEHTTAAEIAQMFYKGDETEVWGVPIDTTSLSPVEMKLFENEVAGTKMHPDTRKEDEIKARLEEACRLKQETLDQKEWNESHRRIGRELSNNVWCYQEDRLWLDGSSSKASEDKIWPCGITIGKALEGSLIRIPWRSDIPKIPNVAPDEKSQQAAWVLIIRHFYPHLSWENITAVFNRIWYGPEIIYHMTARVRIEKLGNRKGPTADQAQQFFLNHELLNKVEQAGRMKALRASKEFACTFPNPRSPGQSYQWFAGIQCVEEKIKDAADRIHVKLEV
ncbi:MAG: hypothetical protein Q9216_007101 [Gyalolechia sp. 2 TL-2023]